MVGTLDPLELTFVFFNEPGSPMSAEVQEGPDLALFIRNQEKFLSIDPATAVLTLSLESRSAPCIQPLLVEDTLGLFFENGGRTEIAAGKTPTSLGGTALRVKHRAMITKSRCSRKPFGCNQRDLRLL